MMKKEKFKESASPDQDRLQKYRMLAKAFSYPDDRFFKYFDKLEKERQEIVADYDILFRNMGIWLYTTEYTAKGEFQKSEHLSDIMGFYKAFGVEPENERPDLLSTELEFMYYLIYKKTQASKFPSEKGRENIFVCWDAARKFFNEHLYPGAQAILKKLKSRKENSFYNDAAGELEEFLESEKEIFGGKAGA